MSIGVVKIEDNQVIMESTDSDGKVTRERLISGHFEVISDKNSGGHSDCKTALKSKHGVIMDIAKNHPLGFTVDKKTLEHIQSGYAVAVSETQDCFGSRGLCTVMEESMKNYIDAIGGWLDTRTNRFSFDAVMIVDDLYLALYLGSKNSQHSIFNINTGEEIKIFKK